MPRCWMLKLKNLLLIKQHVDVANGIALPPESRMREKKKSRLSHPSPNKQAPHHVANKNWMWDPH